MNTVEQSYGSHVGPQGLVRLVLAAGLPFATWGLLSASPHFDAQPTLSPSSLASSADSFHESINHSSYCIGNAIIGEGLVVAPVFYNGVPGTTENIDVLLPEDLTGIDLSSTGGNFADGSPAVVIDTDGGLIIEVNLDEPPTQGIANYLVLNQLTHNGEQVVVDSRFASGVFAPACDIPKSSEVQHAQVSFFPPPQRPTVAV